MSTIKVNSIKNTSTNDGGIAIDNSGHVQIDGQQLPTTGALSNRRLNDNGAMQVAQRGTSFTSNGYTLDRWRFSTNSGAFTVTQSSTAPAGFTNSLKVDCTTTGTPTGQDEGLVETKIEAQNLQHLQFGTSGAQPVTLSFHVKSNKTGSYGLWVYQEDAASQYATTYTVSSADTWEHKTITIPGNTATAINNDNGMGLNFRFYLLAGSDYAGTPAETWTTTLSSNRTTSLNLADSTSNEWFITGVQLEVGEKATAYSHASYGDELARCQRYFQLLQHSSGVGLGTTVVARCTWPLKVTMRANMTIAAVGTPGWFHGTAGATFSALGTNYSIPEMAQMDVTVTGGGGSSVPHFSDSGGTSYFTASAEL